MRQYQDLVSRVLSDGMDVPDRTGTGTRSIFGHQMTFDLNTGFPVVTTKRTFWRGAFVEMLWMLRGDTNTAWLQKHGVHIWDAWADYRGELGPVYGAQWRGWMGKYHEMHDQLRDLLAGLAGDPHSRRHILSSWSVHELPLMSYLPHEQADNGRMALAPCHCLAQFYVDAHQNLHCQLYQRSADVFLGVPFNIAGYALLTHLLAHRLGYGVGKFIHTLGDAHLYSDHTDKARDLLQRTPRPLPSLKLGHARSTPLDEVEPEDVMVTGYHPHPAIKADVSV